MGAKSKIPAKSSRFLCSLPGMRAMKKTGADFGAFRGESRLEIRSYAAMFAIVLLFTTPSAEGQIFRFGHCLLGCPVGAPPENHTLVRSIYTLSYNTGTKIADWVAYQVSSGSIGIASSLSRNLVPDDFVSDTLEVGDFFAIEERGLVRAQFVPLRVSQARLSGTKSISPPMQWCAAII